MPRTLDPELRRALAERVRYCHEMGIYDFYRRESRVREGSAPDEVGDLSYTSQDWREEIPAKKSASVAKPANILPVLTPHLERGVTDPIAALKLIREDL